MTHRALLFLMVMTTFNHATGQNFIELNNDTLHLKLDLSRGGVIAYLSVSGSNRNLINTHDEGRYVQQSYYAGKRLDRKSEGQSHQWSPWPWNPIQVGDAFNNRAALLESKKQGNTVYVKCIPMLWDMNNKPAEAIMEQWTTLTGSVLKVHNKLTCMRTDTLYGEGSKSSQELPAVYPISALKNLYTYLGKNPFTGETFSKLEVKHLEDGFWGRYHEDKITEHWMAFVNDGNWGMAVYTPTCVNFLAGMYLQPGGESKDPSTSYMAPIKQEELLKNSVYEYDYFLLIGDLEEMRSKIYKLNATQK